MRASKLQHPRPPRGELRDFDINYNKSVVARLCRGHQNVRDFDRVIKPTTEDVFARPQKPSSHLSTCPRECPLVESSRTASPDVIHLKRDVYLARSKHPPKAFRYEGDKLFGARAVLPLQSQERAKSRSEATAMARSGNWCTGTNGVKRVAGRSQTAEMWIRPNGGRVEESNQKGVISAWDLSLTPNSALGPARDVDVVDAR